MDKEPKFSGDILPPLKKEIKILLKQLSKK